MSRDLREVKLPWSHALPLVLCVEEDGLCALERLETLTRAQHDRLERLVREVDRDLGRLTQQHVESLQHPAPAGQSDAVHQHLSLIHISEPTRLRRISYAVF